MNHVFKMIIIIIKWKKINQKGVERASGGERWREKNILFFFSLFLSQIYENRTVGFHRG